MQTDLISQAIALARAGQSTEARALLSRILETDPHNETAWMWLVQVLPTTEQRIAALEQWLSANPKSEKARLGLQRLRPGGPDQTAAVQPPPVQTDPLRSVPRYTSPAPPPSPAETRTPPVIPPERGHSPLVLGKMTEEQPADNKSGLRELLRRKEKPATEGEEEIDLGIDAALTAADHSPVVSRVFTSDINTIDFADDRQDSAAPIQTGIQEIDASEISILDQLRGNTGKTHPSRPNFTFRTLVRAFLFLFYLAVFIAVGYFGWKRYGPSISASITGGLGQSPFAGSPRQSETGEPPTQEPEATPSIEATQTTMPTETPVPVIGERPAAGVGLIVYSARSSQGNLDIFTVPPEGGQAVNWTAAHDGDHRDPVLSKDQSKVIYSLNRFDLWQIDKEGQILRLTRDGEKNREPALSPDETRIAYVSERDGNPEIYVMNADGSDPARLTDMPGSDISPTWSPDGTRIAFVSDRNGPLEIYSMQADGTDILRLTYDMGENGAPDWSPDGRWIAFSGNRSGNREIYTVSADGLQQNRLTHFPGSSDHPVWSPEGYWIAFTSDRSQAGLPTLYAMAMDGSKAFAYFDAPISPILTPNWSR